MTPEQIDLVTLSFGRAYAAKRDIARRFYHDLFARAPALRGIFPVDMGLQQEKLNSTLGTMVKELNRLQYLGGALDALARRHAYYDARPEHMALVAEVLLGALERETPDGLSPDEADAWAAAFTWVRSIMEPAMADELRLREVRRAAGEAPPMPYVSVSRA